MEPLSAAASILAVVGAARKAAEGLHRLTAIKDAPKELEDLLLEFSQIETILQSYKNLPTNLQERSPNLATILGIAENKFDELDKLVHYTLTKAGSNEKVDRLQWVRKRMNTERLREQLAQILDTLDKLLNTTSFTTLQEISSTTNEVLNEQKQIQSQVVAVLPEFTAAASQMGQRFEASQSTQLELIRLLRHVQQANLASLSGEGSVLLKDVDQPTGQLINPRSRVSSNHERKIRKARTLRTCQRNCGCNCHNTQQIWTPWAWRKCIGFGSIRISGRYSPQQCNIRGCKRSVPSSLRLDYFLPTWFILRMVSIWYNSSPLHGPELLLRIPVVLPWPKLSSFRDNMRVSEDEHFDRWLRTPSHIDERGRTLLYWAIVSERYDVVNHLLDMGIDLHQPVESFGISSYNMLFHWISMPNRLGQAQQVEAVSKVDWDEYIEDGGLTELHLIVAGLKNRDLETCIRAHPEELEKGDNLGHGPLWYASMFGELTDIRTLLNYGAILDEKSFNFREFFSIFGSKAFDVMEEHLSSGALKSLFKKGCASDWFRFLNTGQLDDDEILAVDKLCLEYGFDVNYEFDDGQTLLMEMSRNFYPGHPLRLKQLVDHGADLELTDIYGKTALHHSIEANGHIDAKTFNVLVENGARLDYRTMDGTTLLHALILNFIHLEYIETILQSDISGLLLDAKDSNGYTAFDLLILRARLLRLDSGDSSVSLEANHTVDAMREYAEYNVVKILGKRMRRANDPDMERKVLTAFEALLHQVQEVQGIPPSEQYPSIESVLNQEDIDAEASRLEGLPGSWPE